MLVQADGVPRLLDFGIAKVLEAEGDETLTQAGAGPMTPRYASPEQIEGRPVSTQSDVYSLGVLLYELLTGTSPYGPETSSAALWRAVCEHEPTRPSQTARDLGARELLAFGADGTPARLRRRLERELDWIVMTALRKEPARRYASVERLADDLSRFLSGRPVHAGPDSWRYRASKLLRRNRVATVAAALAVAALLAGTLAATLSARRANRAAEEEREALQAAADTIFFLEHFVLAGTPDRGSGRDTRMVDALRSARRSIDTIESPYARCAAHALIGSAFSELGEIEASIDHLETAIELAEELGDSGVALADLYQQLGHSLEVIGRDEESIPLLRRGLEILAAPASSSLDRIMPVANAGLSRPLLLNALAITLEDAGHKKEALERFREAAAELSRGDFDDETALILRFNISAAQLARGQFTEAIAGLETTHRDLGSSSSTTTRVGVTSGLGHALCLVGRSAEAEPLLRSVLELAKTELSPQNPWIWTVELSLSRALLLNGKLEECEELAVSLLERPGADGADQEAQLASVLARCWARMGRADEAHALLEPVVAQADEVWGSDLAEHGLLRLAWCECLAGLGRDAEARAELDLATGIFAELACDGCTFLEQADELGRRLGLTD